MNLKIFIIAFASFSLSFFPQNMIGCGGGDIDYYDYYTSFFSANLPEHNTYKPFYYSGYSFLNSYDEPLTAFEVLTDEWAEHLGKKVSATDASLFLTQYSVNDLNVFYNQINNREKKMVADSVKDNSMSQYFLKGKDKEGLRYILFAKETEPFASGDYDYWSPVVRDSIKMSQLIFEGKELYSQTKNDFYKLKYGYQLVRLAQYSRNYNGAIELYDKYVAGNKSHSILQNLSLALKAGALFHIGKNVEAGYLFSKAFNRSDVRKISNYTSFVWCVSDAAAPRSEFLALCKNDNERVDLLALFGLSSTDSEVETINEIFKLSPNAEVLQTLVVREINKLEEKYYTPDLNRQIGGMHFYYSWGDNMSSTDGEKQVKKLMTTLIEIANNDKVKNRGLFETGAAYCAVMVSDYENAKQYLSNAKKMKLSGKVNDQWMLTNILLSLNETDKINANFENQLLPSLIWLKQKAEEAEAEEWKRFYRNITGEILAKRYHENKDLAKEALSIGSAEFVWDKQSTYQGINFIRSNLQSKETADLYNILTSKTLSSFEKFLVENNSIKLDVVTDFAGTAYLRDRDYKMAIEWLSKSSDANSIIEKDPFIDLLYDREEYLQGNKSTTSKLNFAKAMLKLNTEVEASKNTNATSLYKMALGFYNTSYYGYAWELVAYDRSGNTYSRPSKFKNKFEEDYYGCFTAHDYFELAMNASTNKNFKARCLFMMAKSKQKQVIFPSYSDYSNNYDDYEVVNSKSIGSFERSPYFDKLVKEYGNTAFYKEAFNSCSYLRDFVGEAKKKKK